MACYVPPAWIEEVLKPLIGRLDELDEKELDAITQASDKLGGLALLSANTDRTQDYVFESEHLPEIRGASMILDELNRGWPEDQSPNIRKLFDKMGLPTGSNDDSEVPSCIIYAGGGSLLALVPRVFAEEVKEKIEALYPRETGVATITCICREVTPRQIARGYVPDYSYDQLQALLDAGDLTSQEHQRILAYYQTDHSADDEVSPEQFNRRRNFSQVAAVAGTLLRRDKESKVHVPFHKAFPFALRCDSCQLRPAVDFATRHGERWPVCEVCQHKGSRRWPRRVEWGNRFETFLGQSSHDELSARYYAGLSSPQAKELKVSMAHDLGEIGQACEPRSGYIGFIYADGNGVGAFVEQQPTPERYRSVSRAIEEIIEEAVFQALAENLRPCRVKRTDARGRVIGEPMVHPFEVLTIGGDDVLLTVPGHVAVPIAVRICQLFEQGVRDPLEKPLTMSAGIVIADAHNPVRFLRDLADQLLKDSAKQHKEQTAFDFLVLKSQSMLRTDLEQLRTSPPYLLDTVETEKKLRLTACPYTLSEMHTLLRLLKAFRRADFPTTQLHALTSSLQEGRLRSTMFFIYQQARLKERGKALQWLEELWDIDLRTGLMPWQKVDEDPEIAFQTFFADLADLYDFMPRVSGDELTALWQEILA